MHTSQEHSEDFAAFFSTFCETLVLDLEYLLELSLFNLSFVDESQVQNLLKLLRK